MGKIIESISKKAIIEFMKKNPFSAVSHDLFDKDEFLYFDGSVIRDELGYVFEDGKSRNGLRLRSGGVWEIGWLIRHDIKVDPKRKDLKVKANRAIDI